MGPTAQKQGVRRDLQDFDTFPSNAEKLGLNSQDQGVPKDLQEFNSSLSHATKFEQSWLQGLGESPRGNAESSETFEEEEFRRRYEEIWGPRSKKLPPAASVRRVQADEKRPRAARGARPKAVTVIHVGVKSWKGNWQERRPRERAQQEWLNDMRLKTASKRRKLRFRAQNAADRRKIPISRPKWARYLPGRGSSLYAPFSAWHRWFAMLNLRHEKFVKGRSLPRLSIQRAAKFPAAFIRELIEHKSSATLRLEWENFGPRRKMEIWPELMITTLQRHPERALKVMVGTYEQEPFPPAYAVSDCLNYVIAHFIAGAKAPSTRFVRKLCNYVFRLLRIGPKDYLHISQHAIFLLLSNAEIYYVKRLYQLMSDLNHPLHPNTLMNFASRLAKSGETDVALQILHKLKSLNSDFNSPKMLSLCSTILDRSNRGPNGTHSESDIFEYMLECGMTPNLITYNVLLQNSLQVGNHRTAWQIHDMMIESSIEPDAYTYSILLNDAKRRMDSAEIKRVIDMVRERGIKNTYIVTDVLHAIFLLHRHKAMSPNQPSEPQAAFDHMLKVYLEHFRIEPLARIIPWILETLSNAQRPEDPSPTEDELEHPPIPTLALMITTFLHGLQNPWNARQFYDHFRNLLSTGDPVVADLLQTSHIWNSVLMAFGRFPDTLGDCPTVIGDMLAPTNAATINEDSPPADDIAPDSASADRVYDIQSKVEGYEDSVEISKASSQPIHTSVSAQDPGSEQRGTLGEQPRRPLVPPKPNVYTWSILLEIFMQHRQTRAAERVLTMMQEKGVQPNIVTWNTLVAGYARLQDVEMTADAVSRLRRGGLKPEHITMASLRKIRDRRALIEAMNRKEKGLVNPDIGFLDQLQDDMRNLNGSELSPDFEYDDDDFVVGDLEDADADLTVDEARDGFDAQKVEADNVGTRW